MNKNSKIYVAGHTGLVGSAIVRKLESSGYTNLVQKNYPGLDLKNQGEVNAFFENKKPDYVILAATKVGGIHANNTYSAEFIYDNLMIESNIIHAAYMNNVIKLLFLGSSCIYPKFAQQPIKEEYLLTGLFEPSNEAYAIAKIAGIELCKFYKRQYGCNFISAMHTNGRLYNKKLKNGRQSYKVKHYKTKACNTCSLKTQCTTNKLGRFIERTEYQEYVSKNNDRVNQHADYYRQRQQIIEHQFGTLKRHLHFNYTLTKGKEKVLGEVYLAFTCYNLRKIMSILGFEDLMSKIKVHFLSFFLNCPTFFTKKSSFPSIKATINFFNPQIEKLYIFSVF